MKTLRAIKLCSVHHSVLFLLVLVNKTVHVHAVPSVKVKLNQPATLPCKQICSGLVKWTIFHKPVDVLAQCNQTSCQSQDGFEISHSEYLQGNLALMIRSVDYTKRTMYTCDCEGKDLCYLRLSIEAVMWSLQIKPGEDLTMDLLISEPVEVIYNSKDSDSASNGQICRVTEALLDCNDEYKQRVSYNQPNLTLGEAGTSDSGLYIIQDMKNNEVIRMYSISVEEAHPCLLRQKDDSMQKCLIGVIAVLTLLVLLALILLICQHQKHKIREQSNKKTEDEAEEAQAPALSPTSNKSVIQSFGLCRGRKMAEPNNAVKRRGRRCYSDTQLEELWPQVEKLNKGQSSGARRRQRSDASSGEKHVEVCMPLLPEND